MKRAMFLLLALVALLVSCQKETPHVTSLEGEAERVMASIGGKERFLVADEDFVTSNFATTVTPLSATVCFLREGAGEFGLFLLPDGKSAAAQLLVVEAYLQTEGEALRSLAALYPTGELEARLSLYEKALVGKKGALVYYFALPTAEAERAIAAL